MTTILWLPNGILPQAAESSSFSLLLRVEPGNNQFLTLTSVVQFVQVIPTASASALLSPLSR